MADDIRKADAHKALADSAKRAANAHGDKKPFAPRANGAQPAHKKFDSSKPGSHKPYGRPMGKPSDAKPHGDKGNAAPQARPADGTPSRRAAHKALGLVTRDKAYAGLALDRVFETEHLSAQDRALATEIFYGTLENMLKLDYLLRQLMSREAEPPVMDVLRISAYQLLYLTRVPENAVCNEAVNLTRKLGFESATGMVNAVLRNLVRKRSELKLPTREDGIEQFLSIEYSIPEFVCARLVAQYGADEAEKILAWKPQKYITVRPNTLRTSPSEFENSMDKLKLRYEKSRVPGAYRVYGMGSVERNPLYKAGLFSVQGESSLICAQALALKPAMQVLDACAAPGGKAAAMAEIMQGSGRVYACDLHPHRVELIRATASRLGHDTIKPRVQDASVFNADWEYSMDAVLCDVPCSGLGVIASKPDIKRNITQEELEELPNIQLNILNNCARYLKRGGVLVYSTCTILRSENQDVVNAFLQSHPDYMLCDISDYVPECFKGGIEDGMLSLLGCRNDTDGFFVARMVRK